MRPLLALALLGGCKVNLVPDEVAPKKDPTAAWGETYSRAVTADGYVDYDVLEAERESLDAYVAWLAEGRQPAGRLPKYAYWLNAYNALVMYAVLEFDRPPSVLDVETDAFWPGPTGATFFQQLQFKLGPDRQSLSEVEHERLRGIRQDVRLHAAINCASWSCPPLRETLYVGATLEADLDVQMTRWVMDPERGVRIEDGKAIFTPIMDWFAIDFYRWTGGQDLCTTAAQYALEPLKGKLSELAGQGCPHEFFEYDWSLNDAGVDRRASDVPPDN